MCDPKLKNVNDFHQLRKSAVLNKKNVTFLKKLTGDRSVGKGRCLPREMWIVRSVKTEVGPL